MAEIRTINIGKEFVVKFGECETNASDETIAAVCKDLSIHIEQAIRDKIVENGEISVAPVNHGHWIRPDVPNTRSYKWQCSECGQIAYWLHYGNRGNKNIICKYSYCPNCGAKMNMDGDKNGS